MEVFDYLNRKMPKGEYLYLVGGSSRDYLLKRPFKDFDFATSLAPQEAEKVFKNEEKFNFAFARFGIVEFKYRGYDITLATFRKENNYQDQRHPTELVFLKGDAFKEDSLRRDFTINAIYLDAALKIKDPQKGQQDLEQKLIRMIGPIETRINEDPLRILRAYRFASSLGFRLEDNLADYCEEHIFLIQELNPQKVESELKKFTPEGKRKMLALLGVKSC